MQSIADPMPTYFALPPPGLKPLLIFVSDSTIRLALRPDIVHPSVMEFRGAIETTENDSACVADFRLTPLWAVFWRLWITFALAMSGLLLLVAPFFLLGEEPRNGLGLAAIGIGFPTLGWLLMKWLRWMSRPAAETIADHLRKALGDGAVILERTV
jgi:hypothetical protein